MNTLNMLVQVIGGLGLFLFGMNLMGEGLEKAAGDGLKGILEKVTNNRIIGVLIGAFVTAIIQSSSATTVMIVGFVNAGLMNLMQAAGVIMGANIGTTITAQMVSFKLDAIAPLFIGIGAIAFLTMKKRKSKDIASIFLGFGILFMGMGVMSGALKPIAQSPAFTNVISIIGDNKLLGVLTGLGLTAVVQSSSATTGILIALATTGTIGMNVALPVIFGCNIGTCVTALLASAGANRIAKKAALLHLLFNVIGVLMFLPFTNLMINIVGKTDPTDVARQVANAHTIFNVTVTLVLLPFAKYLVMIVNRILPGDDKVEKEGAIYLDRNLLETPVLALSQVFKETVRMGGIAKENIEKSMQAFLENDEDAIEFVYNKERIINNLEREITDYLVQLSGYELPDRDSRILSSTFHIINDIERIGDHAKNIVELAREKIDGKMELNTEAKDEVVNMYENTLKALTFALDAYREEDSSIASKVRGIESKIDKYEKDLRENNIRRLNERICSANVSTIFLDLVSNLERIGDHATNIADIVM